MRPPLVALLAALALTAPATAQDSNTSAADGTVQPEAQQAAAATGDAPAATIAEPATPTSTMAETSSGSTGWTGGTGGAFVGTNPQGAVAVSKSWQPPTARGLDLKMGAAEPG